MPTELYSYHSIFITMEQFTIVWSQHLSYLKRERYQLYQYIQFFLRKLKENYKWIKIEILEKINFLIVDPQLNFVKFKRSLTFKFIYRDYKKKTLYAWNLENLSHLSLSEICQLVHLKALNISSEEESKPLKSFLSCDIHL